MVGRLVPCKVCGGATEIQGWVDAGRSCEVARQRFLPLTGMPVLYQRCVLCSFVFTSDFDDWTRQEFKDRIYNDDYIHADPDYVENRPRANAPVVASVARQMNAARVLDYGGGNGLLARLLREGGVAADSWDVMSAAQRPEEGAYDLVTAFEVFEHTPRPRESAADALAFLRPGGRLLFSTLLHDLPRQTTDWWYLAPRNGHLSIHSQGSLKALFDALGWPLTSFSRLLHTVVSHPRGAGGR